jgi:iron complex transport system substrate-binding protein
MLFAISAGTQVIAVDDQSTFPADAPRSDLSGFSPNVEAIVARQPDLVVVSNDIDNIVAALQAAQVPVLVEPAATTIEDTYQQITELGQATGRVIEAAQLVATMKQRIAAAIAQAPGSAGLTFYHELDNTLYTATSDTFIGAVYDSFGLVNIADDAPDAATGYPQLSAEWIIAKDPRLVFLADTKCCAQNSAAFAARPGFSGLTAVTSDGVVELDDDIASRWGPRTADLYEAVAAAIAAVR